jgi:class 3 adenylate cyclase
MSQDLERHILEDQFQEAKAMHRIFMMFGVVYVGFAFADYVYFPSIWMKFLVLRIAYVAAPVSLYILSNKAKSFFHTEVLASVHAVIASGIITYMIFSTEGVTSPYYAGLNLVGVIALCFFTFSMGFFCLTAGLIYVPYFVLAFFENSGEGGQRSLVLNSFFMMGTVIVCGAIRFAKEKNRRAIIVSKLALENELANREEIIHKKTEEAVSLSVMERQFSPQVVESIKSGSININSGSHRTLICAIFIDIVNSTERVTRIDKDKVERTLSRFLDDSIKIFLKYDITIDKFLGDGLLAFCNAPLKRVDYVERVVNAALEIRQKLKEDQNFYEINWLKDFQIRVGISTGYANVGFYGSKKYFQSYTAIGPVINLASRLCSSAEPGQILVDHDVFESVGAKYETHFVGRKTLKGFEEDIFHVYEIKSITATNVLNPGINECETCGSILSLETTPKGHFVFVCKTCITFSTAEELKKSAA